MAHTGRWVGRIALGLVMLIFAVVGISAASNINLPAGPDQLDQLSPLDKARLAESISLRRSFGDIVWPGWGEGEMPIILWNREVEFLIGTPAPTTAWTPVADESFLGEVYYHRPAENPQNFAVRLGDPPNEIWAASMGTKWEADLFLREMFQSNLPPILAQIVPYRLLILPSEVQITGVLHETFHVFQAQAAMDRLAAAEAAQSREGAYFRAAGSVGDGWTEETHLLRAALDAPDTAESAELAGQFLAQRATRRTNAGMDPNLVEFERQLEWEEGLAKYVELITWREAADMSTWQPVPQLAQDDYFQGYKTFDRRWGQELGTLERSGNEESTTRFYYTGMAQAVLLDRLAPDWKAQIMQPGVWLEDLLAAALN